MLEFLFDFIERNILLVFLCVLLLGIASAYSKGIKFLFLSILGTIMTYFAFLCFYRLGYGFESLYQWSCEIVIRICYYIDYYSFFCYNHSYFITKILEYLMQQTSSGVILCMMHILVSIGFILIACFFFIPKLRLYTPYKLDLNFKDIHNVAWKYNTINRVQSRYILNSVFRC